MFWSAIIFKFRFLQLLVQLYSGHDSDQLYLCRAEDKIGVFRLFHDDAVDTKIIMIRIKMLEELQMLMIFK